MSVRCENEIKKIKVLLLGEANVGKTSILLRYMQNKFSSNNLATIGVQYKQKEVKVCGDLVRLQGKNEQKVWDTAGQQKHKSVAPTYYRNVNGVVFVYDITNYSSFQNIQIWIQILKQNTDLQNLAIFLVGNKTDLPLEREVPPQTAHRYATQTQMHFLETSAKDHTNLQELFQQIIHSVLLKTVVRSQEKLLLARNQPQNTNCC